MTDERPKPSKAPKPIEPVRGTGYTMRACNQPANWDEWAYRVSAALWEAVALAHDFEPSTLPVDWRPADYSHPFADCPAEVALHIRIACDHAENGKLKCIASANYSVRNKVALSDFAGWWTVYMGRRLPDRFPRGPKAELGSKSPGQLAQVQESDAEITGTGLPGRRTSWHLIAAECRRRYEAKERHPNNITTRESPTEWASVLIDWLQSAHPKAPSMKAKTLASNKLPSLLRNLEAACPKP